MKSILKIIFLFILYFSTSFAETVNVAAAAKVIMKYSFLAF